MTGGGVQNVQCTYNWRTKKPIEGLFTCNSSTLDTIERLFSQIEGPLGQLKDYWRMKDKKCPSKDIEGQSD